MWLWFCFVVHGFHGFEKFLVVFFFHLLQSSKIEVVCFSLSHIEVLSQFRLNAFCQSFDFFSTGWTFLFDFIQIYGIKNFLTLFEILEILFVLDQGFDAVKSPQLWNPTQSILFKQMGKNWKNHAGFKILRFVHKTIEHWFLWFFGHPNGFDYFVDEASFVITCQLTKFQIWFLLRWAFDLWVFLFFLCLILWNRISWVFLVLGIEMKIWLLDCFVWLRVVFHLHRRPILLWECIFWGLIRVRVCWRQREDLKVVCILLFVWKKKSSSLWNSAVRSWLLFYFSPN